MRFQCCAISFVENMTADSINMDAEEFESYVSGKSVPPGSWRTSLLMCEGLQQMSHNLKSLSDFKARHDQVLQEALRLQDEMAAFQVIADHLLLKYNTGFLYGHPEKKLKKKSLKNSRETIWFDSMLGLRC